MGRENHFVPQFYLRRFSPDGKQISLYNFARGKVIERASIKNQASRRGFYDFNPKIEGALSGLEGDTAGILQEIDSTGNLPANDTPQDFQLKFFILMQLVRTEAAGHMAEGASDYFSPQWLQANPKIRESGIDTSGLVIRTKFPHALPMQVMAENAHLVRELRLHLFLNKTQRSFITSDNPVVAHNMYCEGLKGVGVLGLRSAGYMCVWPISSRRLLLMYDADVYSVGAFRREVVSSISDLAEISNLNKFQVLGAHENVYFSARDGSSDVEKCCKSMELSRPKTHTAFVRTDRVENPDGTSTELIASHQIMLPIKLRVSAVAVRRRKRSVPLGERPNMAFGRSRKPGSNEFVRYRVSHTDER